MIITLLFLIVLFVQLSKTISLNRKVLSIVALGVYLLITLFDLYWLESIDKMSFHPSDPTEYYNKVKGISLRQVFAIESSNTFYYIINWAYQAIWHNTMLISLLLKVNNVLVTVCIYLLLTKKLAKVTYIDYLLLFNPYTIMTLIRNVRDMYIVLFVVMIILGLGIIKDNKLNFAWTLLGVAFLFITRSVLLLPLFLIYWMQHKAVFSTPTRWVIYIFSGMSFIYFLPKVISTVGNQMISAMDFIGENYEPLLPLISGGISVSNFIFLIKRIFIGTISFLFTPHPVSFITKWLESMDATGSSGIYTGFDNFLISIGSVFNYLLVIPIVIGAFINYRKMNKYIMVFAFFFIFLYVVSYLGITDIRNRNTAIYFILLGVLFADEPIKMKLQYYILTICLFVGLLFVSA